MREVGESKRNFGRGIGGSARGKNWGSEEM